MAPPVVTPRPGYADGSFTLAQKAGLTALCASLVFAKFDDITLQLIGAQLHLSSIILVVLIPMFLFSGRMLQGLQSKTGRYWLAFLLLGVLASLFGYWPTAGLEMMWGYFTKGHIIFFIVCAFAVTQNDCRRLFYAKIIEAVTLLFACFTLGGATSDGRFILPRSYLFNNANDLALELLFAAGFFIYLVHKPMLLSRVIGAAGLIACTVFTLKTASRGGMLAFAVFLAALVLTSRNRVAWIALATPLLFFSLLWMPARTLHRLTLIFLKPDVSQSSEEDLASIESQMERTELLKRAVRYSFTHPLLGVGPGQFMNVVWSDEHRSGKHPPALGTHNTYLEVSSECGLPAFFCYAAVVLGCIRINYKTMKRARRDGSMPDLELMAFCLFVTASGFAVNIFFHHLAYSGYLPFLAGMTIALSSISLPTAAAQPAPMAGPAPFLRSRPART